MASRKDMQDIMGLSTDGIPKAAAQKKTKLATGKRPKLAGMGREVQALMGERPPPVAVYDEKMSYKAKRSKGPAKKWEPAPFTNSARTDGLVLRHWRRKGLMKIKSDGPDAVMEDIENRDPDEEQPSYEFAKYNVPIEVPEYTDEQYNLWLQDDDWSREETDYLVSMVKDYYYRWPAIWDRYDFQPAAPSIETDGDAPPPSSSPKPRTMEDLKYRFYRIQARLMALKTPESHMTQSEYSLWDMLQSYNPQRERDRKHNASGLMLRSLEETKEEEILLGELQRIAISAERMEAERNEIRAVHDAPHATNSVAQFQSSQALTALFNTLFQQDRSKKRQSTSGAPGSAGGRLSITAADLIGTPSGATPPGHRDSIVSAGPGSSANKKGSLAGQPVRSLPAEAEKRFGITTHDRLQSGISFRSDKMFKLRQAKSGAQTQKMAAALTELSVPEVVIMPSPEVCDSFEKLTQRVTKLLESRKHREKEEGEFKIVKNMVDELRRRVRKEEGLEDEPAGEGGTEAEATAEATNNADTTEIGDEDDATESRQESARPTEADDDADGDEESDANAETELNGDDDDDDDADGDDDAEAEQEDDVELDGEGDEDDADGETETNGVSSTRDGVTPASPPILTGHKRSASVLSASSSVKSNKRTRK